MSNPNLTYYLSSVSHRTTAETTWVRQSHIMQLPGSWSWPLHHLSRWKMEEKSLTLVWGTQIFVLICPRCGLSFIKHGNGEILGTWDDSFTSYQTLVLLWFQGVTLQKFYQMYWLSAWFILVNTLSQEQLIPMWQHIIITQWWHMDCQWHMQSDLSIDLDSEHHGSCFY